MPVLIAASGNEAGRLYPLEKSETVIGRGERCDIRVTNSATSRIHALIRLGADGAELVDMNSSNGTVVNTERVRRCLLQADDVIHFGKNAVFRFTYITEAEGQYLKKLHQAALCDTLTGLANRQLLLDELDSRLNENRSGLLSLLMIDVDRFKLVNDTFGHLLGDLALQYVATLIASGSRPNDLVGRYGGEEFMMVVNGVTLEETLQVAERIRTMVESKPLQSGDVTLPLTVSIGVASAYEVDRDKQQLIALADSRLYTAKKQGRNRVCPNSMLHGGLKKPG
ncbi:diguanylate cyclase (GGDEF)-like protein [Azospirillum agricola]|uniref:GGDEF domain-containing protein n=1 Tax=Azospirillum agricola TaxID=1720247 RepID=UPI001AE55D31|nr:GGDEF domain-containing protein [Azospirillum agricola]MBP2231235.1 diguanylate cyclase (GGDEF)-like protein [Azospirillum agricola]